MPIETEHASEGLKPVRVREPLEKRAPPVLDDHRLDNRGRKLLHPPEQPRRRAPRVKREVGATGSCRHRAYACIASSRHSVEQSQ